MRRLRMHRRSTKKVPQCPPERLGQPTSGALSPGNTTLRASIRRQQVGRQSPPTGITESVEVGEAAAVVVAVAVTDAGMGASEARNRGWLHLPSRAFRLQRLLVLRTQAGASLALRLGISRSSFLENRFRNTADWRSRRHHRRRVRGRMASPGRPPNCQSNRPRRLQLPSRMTNLSLLQPQPQLNLYMSSMTICTEMFTEMFTEICTTMGNRCGQTQPNRPQPSQPPWIGIANFAGRIWQARMPVRLRSQLRSLRKSSKTITRWLLSPSALTRRLFRRHKLRPSPPPALWKKRLSTRKKRTLFITRNT